MRINRGVGCSRRFPSEGPVLAVKGLVWGVPLDLAQRWLFSEVGTIRSLLEHEHDHLIPSDLAPVGIQPDHRLRLFEAEQDHIVIRGDHDLVGRSGMVDDRLIGGAPRRSAVWLIPHITHVISEFPQGACHSPGKVLIE